MKVVVVIPTYGRKAQTALLLARLEQQTRPPNLVLVSAPDHTHVQPYSSTCYPVSFVFGKTGLCAQRNVALELALQSADIVTFFDDDFIPAHDYLYRVVAAFEQHPDWAVVMGKVVADGARGIGLDWATALMILSRFENHTVPVEHAVDHVGAYGCNMSIRTSLIGDLRFDEKLVLYGWQEDIDFTSQLRKRGRVVGLQAPVGVHLGIKKGKVSGRRFGYSQVMNPIYLIKKGTVPPSFVLELMARNILANICRSFWPESYIDRRGRLAGNLIAALHILCGRIDPVLVLEIPDA
jgi:GT2 family glycosyltransferase